MDAVSPPTTQMSVPPSAPDGTQSDATETQGRSTGRIERWAREHPVSAVAAALILVHLAIRAAWVSDTWFAEDDFTWISGSYGEPFTWDFLTQDVAGHLLIGCWALSWLITKVAPYEHWPAALIVLIMLATAAILFWRLLRQLFGERPATLIPLTLYLFWAMTTTTTIWWSAAVLWIPVQIAFSAALLAHLRYLRTHRLRDAAASTAIMAIGLIFFEKAVFIPCLLFAFTVFYAIRGPLWRRVLGALRTAWPVWTAQTVVAAAFTWLYTSTVTSVSELPSEPGKVFELARNVFVNSFATQAWGGPWSWGEGTSAQGAYAAPPSVLVWIAGALCLGVIALSLFAGVRSLYAWTILAAYMAIDVALLAVARLGFIGPEIGLLDRYISDVAFVAALAVGLAFIPLRGPGAPPQAEPPAPGGQPFAWLQQRPVAANVAVAAVVGAVALSSSVSAADLHSRWAQAAPKPYFAALRADLQARPGREDMFDATVPPQVVNPLVAPANRLSVLMSALPEQPRFPVSTYAFVAPDRSGHLHDGTVEGIRSRPGPVRDCGWAARGAKGVAIPLERAAYAWPWVIRIGYFTSDETRAEVSLGDQTVQVELRPGLNDLFVKVSGEGSAVRLDGLDPQVTVCVAEAVVGAPAPRVGQ